MRYFLFKYNTFFTYLLCFLALQVRAQEGKPAVLDWCFDNISGAHQMLGSPAKPSGPSADLMRYLAKEVGFTLNAVAPIPSLRCFKLLGTGEVDIMTNLTYHPKLFEAVNLYKYLEKRRPNRIVLLANDERNIDSVKSLMALQIALVRGYDYGEAIFNLIENSEISYLYVNSAEDALNMIKKNRVEAAILPLTNALSIERQNQETHLFKHLVLPQELRASGALYVGLSKNSDNLSLGPKIEQALNKAMESGLIDELLNQSNTINP